ncbi:hypothetical protein BBJ41_29980 [Burkholderia stabilis]|uniref:hypothetical protein n=1 Tax=Burkholderia stabilis TaxID=95485 RepID=UPI0008519BCA|nr:hypothetical protein [Burkholderia stabilis]AOR71676.1 hypothetical protein BBJ41_29980 [Burkholderia stabilis]HDR9491640.1 hypothetical protein [Burkholderia stabilis]HDR9522261.1 hypothetical protein [Burkholderia stabilis]HDR9529510.1 hypothetical protein [Burkholderia stabilis]HDR9539091.1 hypothetical protein [Burkholderia stabilis]
MQPVNAADFDRIWPTICDTPAWSVTKGQGSFLTFEFGQPELEVREPRAGSPDLSAAARDRLASRRVTVAGNGHLWICYCHWSIALDGREFAHSESRSGDIAAAAQRLDGQILQSLAPGAEPGAWAFDFDLRGKLTTWPYGDDPSDEQWHLFDRRSGNVLTARADGTWSYGPANDPPGEGPFRPA